MKVLWIIQVFNEELRLPTLLKDIIEFKRINKFNIEFLIINNGSTDDSLNMIKSSTINYISLKKNKGIGYSLLLGLKIGSKNKYDTLIHMAGNNKMSPFDLDKVLKPIFFEKVDYVSGTRFGLKKNFENIPLFRKISIRILSLFFSIVFKRKITDATCGFRAMKINKIINNFKLFNKKKFYTYGYEYYSYGKILLSKNIKSCEVDVKMNYPKDGKYSKIRPIIDWYPIIFGYLEAFVDRNKLI